MDGISSDLHSLFIPGKPPIDALLLVSDAADPEITLDSPTAMIPSPSSIAALFSYCLSLSETAYHAGNLG